MTEYAHHRQAGTCRTSVTLWLSREGDVRRRGQQFCLKYFQTFVSDVFNLMFLAFTFHMQDIPSELL